MKELVLASHNPGKLRELQALLGDSIHIRPISEFTAVEPDETGLTFIENAILKARHACQVSGLPALADDSGLTVDYLQGAPGIHSARYSATGKDADNNHALLTALQGVADEHRSAHFVCVLALLQHAADPLPIICEGRWQGRILHAPQGEHGFGYDPLFYVAEQQCSAAQMPDTLKNQLSHRAQAMQLLKQRLAV